MSCDGEFMTSASCHKLTGSQGGASKNRTSLSYDAIPEFPVAHRNFVAQSKEMAAKRSRLGEKHGKRPMLSDDARHATKPSAHAPDRSSQESWTFLSNHSHVLVALAKGPNLSLREVALLVGITERSVQRIVTDLEEAGYLTKEKVGRNNQYSIKEKIPLRHPLEKHCDVGELLDLIVDSR